MRPSVVHSRVLDRTSNDCHFMRLQGCRTGLPIGATQGAAVLCANDQASIVVFSPSFCHGGLRHGCWAGSRSSWAAICMRVYLLRCCTGLEIFTIALMTHTKERSVFFQVNIKDAYTAKFSVQQPLQPKANSQDAEL